MEVDYNLKMLGSLFQVLHSVLEKLLKTNNKLMLVTLGA